MSQPIGDRTHNQRQTRAKAPSRWLRVNLRVIIFILVLLVAGDVVLRFAVHHYLDTGVRRLPADDVETITLWREHMARGREYKIVFVGDSVVYGGGVRQEQDTLPAYFSQYIQNVRPDRDIRVYNFSLRGCTPGDTYQILRYIAEAKPDLVIYDANLAWFSGIKEVVEHKTLLSLDAHRLPPEVRSLMGSQPSAPEVESRLSEVLGQHWLLYRNRVFFNYWWFGQPVRDSFKLASEQGSFKYLLPHSQDSTPEKRELYKPWYQKDPAKLVPSVGPLGQVFLVDTNPRWLMFQELVRLMDQLNVPAVIFLPPCNRALLDQTGMINEPALYENQAKIKAVARQHNITVFDYTWEIDSSLFVDWGHLNPAGNRQLAEMLGSGLRSLKFVSNPVESRFHNP